MTKAKDRNDAGQRMRHASIAGVVALVLSFLTLLEPLDQLVWVMEARLASFEASGDIAYLGSDDDLADAQSPHRREALAQALDTMRAAGVERVYLDVVFDRKSSDEADARLAQAIAAFDGDAVLVGKLSTGLNGEDQLRRTIPEIAGSSPEVVSDLYRNYMGYTWSAPYQVTYRDESLPSLPASLANIAVASDGEFPIDYAFSLRNIPALGLDKLLEDPARAGATLAGKRVVIGNNLGGADARDIPGHIGVPASIVNIYAAETLKAGHTDMISGYVMLLVVLSALCLFGQSLVTPIRYSVYAVLALGLPVAVVVAAHHAVKISVAGATVMLVCYWLLRARVRWQKNFRLVDPDTGMPTFAVLENDKEVRVTVPTVIVAKIHRFEEVRKTLAPDLHTEYLIRIVDRLKAAKKEATIYIGPGHLIAWTFPEKEPALIREHLEGLRALFSAPLQVGGNQVDVGITFGADITPSPNVTRRLAAAVSAAERTTETYEPIQIAELASDEDLIWNISLQARIDNALANGEIYLIYQPKILVQTGELVGVEALVRWRDPVKGLIPPDHFIRQCENAGRMAHLTRHVLGEACRAGNAFEDNGMVLPVAVNISATMVHERDIVDMVRETLEETGFDPRRLTLEITETYRISNFERASEILEALAALGPKISMDDFGVGAASLEALQLLPFTELKIDRAFTAAMKSDVKAAGIVRSVLQMGRDLRIIVVAEGVEDEATLTLLRDSGCQVAQGFGISRPISFDEVMKFQAFKSSEPLRDMV